MPTLAIIFLVLAGILGLGSIILFLLRIFNGKILDKWFRNPQHVSVSELERTGVLIAILFALISMIIIMMDKFNNLAIQHVEIINLLKQLLESLP